MAPRSPIGEWMTPPPSSSRAPQPVLQRRQRTAKTPEIITPPPQPTYFKTGFTPSPLTKEQQAWLARISSDELRRTASPKGPSWLPDAPSALSVQMEVVESEETIIEGPADQVDALEYEVAEPFGGRRSPGILDTSPMQLDLERSFIEEDMKGFKWMDR